MDNVRVFHVISYIAFNKEICDEWSENYISSSVRRACQGLKSKEKKEMK